MIPLLLQEILRAAFTGLLLHRTRPVENVTTITAPDIRSLVGAQILGNAITNPRRTLGSIANGVGTIAGGVQAVTKTVTGSAPEAYEIQRTASDLMGDIAGNVIQLEDAIRAMHDVIAQQTQQATRNHRNGLIFTVLLPIGAYIGYRLTAKPAVTKALHESVNSIVASIPSDDKISAIVRQELKNKQFWESNAVITINYYHLGILLLVVIISGIVYLVIKNRNRRDDDPSNPMPKTYNQDFNKYRDRDTR